MLTEQQRIKSRERGRRYQRKHRERLLLEKREWLKKNAERHRETQQAWRQRNRDRQRAISRKSRLRTKFGVTIEQYDEMLRAQGGRCAICLDLPSSKRRLAIDHNHQTGAVRGLLCGQCNTMLGKSRDSIEILLKGVGYLSRETALRFGVGA